MSVDELRLDNSVDQFTSYIEDRTDGFVGRGFVFEAIERFQKAKPSSYFVIEGPPGIGKSAIIAQLAKLTGCVVHFNIRSAGITRPEQFLRSVYNQLKSRYGLASFQPSVDTVYDGPFLTRLLAESAGRLPSGERLMIAIDALDEVETLSASVGCNVLYLPPTLPKGVHFVLTTRRKADLPFVVQAEEEIFDLRRYGDENLRDVREYLQAGMQRRKLRDWISQNRIAVEDFVAALTERSEGNFMYLRYVMPAIEKGEYRDLTIAELPHGLEGYYDDHWRRMGMTARPLPEAKIKIVYILAEIGQPVSRALVSEFARETDLTVQAVINEWLEFLQVDTVNEEARYSLYHTSFRDFLHRKEIVRAAGVTLPGVHALIAESLWEDLMEHDELLR